MATDSDEAAAPTAMVTVEDAAHLEELRQHHDLLVADFYADWCGPCVVVGDFLESVAMETPATVAKIDVEVNTTVADDHSVRSLPTVVLFHDGDPVERLVGLTDEERLHRAVERYADKTNI